MHATIREMRVLPNDHVIVQLRTRTGRIVPIKCCRCHNALFTGALYRQGLALLSTVAWNEIRRELPGDFMLPTRGLIICCNDTAVGILEYLTRRDLRSTTIIAPDAIFFLSLFFDIQLEVREGTMPKGVAISSRSF